MRAARYLKVPPWDLEQQPSYWRDLALAFEGDEKWAEAEVMKRAPKTPSRGRKR